MSKIKLEKDLSYYTVKSRSILSDFVDNNYYFNKTNLFNLDTFEDTILSIGDVFEDNHKISSKDAVSDEYINTFKSTNSRLILFYRDPSTGNQTEIVFTEFELPESLKIKTVKAGPTHKFPGGVITNQIMGDFLEPITWSGILRGENAYVRRELLRTVFTVDTPVTLVYKTNKDISSNNTGSDIEQIQGVIGDLEIDHNHLNNINYTITIKPHQNIKETTINRDTTFEELSILIAEQEVIDEEKKKELEENPRLPVLQGSELSDSTDIVTNSEIQVNEKGEQEIFKNNKDGTVLIPKKDDNGVTQPFEVKANDDSYVIEVEHSTKGYTVGDQTFEYAIILQNKNNPLVRTKILTNNDDIARSIGTKIEDNGYISLNKNETIYPVENPERYNDEDLKTGVIVEMSKQITTNDKDPDITANSIAILKDKMKEDYDNNSKETLDVLTANGKNLDLGDNKNWSDNDRPGYLEYIKSDVTDVNIKLKNPDYTSKGEKLIIIDDNDSPNGKTNPNNKKSEYDIPIGGKQNIKIEKSETDDVVKTSDTTKTLNNIQLGVGLVSGNPLITGVGVYKKLTEK